MREEQLINTTGLNVAWNWLSGSREFSRPILKKKKNQHHFALLWILIENYSASAAQGISFTTSKTTKQTFSSYHFFSLQIFFEGVQECIAAGVKEDEVGYQLAFSKQELRKNIKEYPAKDIKKGLELLYKKVEKHLCEEENLLQVK